MTDLTLIAGGRGAKAKKRKKGLYSNIRAFN